MFMKKIKSNYLFLCSIQIMVFSFCLINCIIHDIAVISGVKIFLYQFFAWFLAGYVIFNCFKIKVNNFTEVIALSYAFGGISALIIYMIMMLPGIGFLLPYFTIVEGIICVIYFYKSQEDIEKYKDDFFTRGICLFFLFVFFILTLCAVSFVNTMPGETLGGTGYYVDWPFWAGNNIAFTRKFPSDCFRQVGTPFYYHHFSSILIAMVSLCTKVDVNQITFYFSSILAGIIFIFSGFYFATRIKTTKILVFILMIAAMFTDGTTVTYTWHINICPFGFDYGYAYGMLSVAFLAEIILNNKFKELFLPSIFVLAMTTGCKGPIGVIILVAYGMVAISFLVEKHISRGIFSGVAWLASFSLVYFTFISSPWITDTAAGLQYIGGLDIDTVVTKAPWITNIYNSLLSVYRIQGDRLFVKLYSVWLYIYRADKIISMLLVIALALIIKDLFKKHFDSLLYTLVTASFVGILLAIYTTQSGGSQMYFLMGMFPVASMAGIYALHRFKNEYGEMRILYRALYMLVLCILTLSVNRYYEAILPKIREGIAVIRDRYTESDYRAYYADSIDFEAFEWLNENTDENTIFAVDSFVNAYGENNHMIAGIFSQRFVWNEEKYIPNLEEGVRRNAIVSELNSDINSAIEKMKHEGVKYLLSQVSVDKVEYGNLTDDMTEVFRNNHYVIYEFK